MSPEANSMKVNAMTPQVEMAKKQVTQALASAKVHLARAEKDIHKKIQTHPEQAVLIASAIGIAVGALATYGILKTKKK